ncbi:hypothetical protein NECAME_07623, partial [Necator americanus]
MTANRLLVVLYPLKYNVWFTKSKTATIIIIAWLLAFIVRLDYVYSDCHFVFDVQSKQFIYTACSRILPFIANSILALFTTTLDIFSLSRIKNISEATINSALYLSMLGLFCIADYLDDDTIKFFLTVI